MTLEKTRSEFKTWAEYNEYAKEETIKFQEAEASEKAEEEAEAIVKAADKVAAVEAAVKAKKTVKK